MAGLLTGPGFGHATRAPRRAALVAVIGLLLAGAALPFVVLFPEPPAFGRSAAGITAAVAILSATGPCFGGGDAQRARALRRAGLLFITTLTAATVRILLAREGVGTLPTIDLLPRLFGLQGEDIDDAVLYEAWVELWLACGAGVVMLNRLRRVSLTAGWNAAKVLLCGRHAESHGLAGRRGVALMVLVVLAVYLLRFASSWWLLAHGLGRHFDPHAFGLLGDAILLAVGAPPLAGLLWWVLRRRGAWRGLFAPAAGPGWTLLSVLLLLVIGAPTPNQVWAILLLPAADAWPAMLSAAGWFATVALLRAIGVTGRRSSAR